MSRRSRLIIFMVVLAICGGRAAIAEADSSFVTSVSLNSATLRTNIAGEVGLKFTTGTSPIQVTRLCRYYYFNDPGTQTSSDLSTQTHTVTLYTSGGTSVGSAVVNNNAGFVDANGFKCTILATPIALAASTSYYLLSSETTTGTPDNWYDDAVTVTPRVGSISNAATRVSGVITNAGTTNNSYGPENFYYTQSLITTANLGTTATWNTHAGNFGMKITVGSSPIIVNRLCRYFVSGNNQVHTLKLWTTAGGTPLASVTVDMSTGTADSNGFKCATVSPALPLTASTSYYITSSETSGGDLWHVNAPGSENLANSGAASINGGVGDEGSPGTFTFFGTANSSYGPVDLYYTPAATGTRYIDNSVGSGCSDANAGTTTAAPWCDFANVNNTYWAPGSSINLKSGDTWNVHGNSNNALYLNATGAVLSGVAVSSYGTGAKPILEGNATDLYDSLGFILDPDYVTISNLQLQDAGQGLWVNYYTQGHTNVSFTNIYATNLDLNYPDYPGQGAGLPAPTPNGVYWSTSIIETNSIATGASDYAVQNVTYDNIETNDASLPSWVAAGISFTVATGGYHTFKNLVIKNSYFHDSPGDMALYGVSGGSMLATRFVNNGFPYKGSGHSAVFVYATDHFNVIDSMLNSEQQTSPVSADEVGLDVEGYDDLDSFVGDVFADNAGFGSEFSNLAGRPSSYITNAAVTASWFYDNGIPRGSGVEYSLRLYNYTGDTNSGTALDNLYHEANGFSVVSFGTPTWTLTNNNAVTSLTDANNAPTDYTETTQAVPWSYYRNPGTGWVSLSWDSTNKYYGSATNGYVNRFNEQPGTCNGCSVQRRWTAPYSGTISLRGWVAKNTSGDGVNVQITKNGSVIWPVSGTAYALGGADQVGVETSLDGISVAQGDVIGFEIINTTGSGASNLTTWAPTVAYTAYSITTALTVGNSSFETPAYTTSPFWTYGPITGASWTFAGSACCSGIQRNGSAWQTGPPVSSVAPDGSQAALLQGGTTGACFSQSISGFTAGKNYIVQFKAAQRGGTPGTYGNQTIQVKLDSTLLGSVRPPDGSPPPYVLYTLGALNPGAGSHTLQFCGTVGTGGAAFVDAVAVGT